MTQLSNGQIVVAFMLLAILGGAVWIHADRHGSKHPTAWAMFVVFAPLPALLIYVFRFRRARRR